MYKRIVVPLDGSKVAEAILPHATDLARALGAEIALLRVVQEGGVLQGRYILPTEAARLLAQHARADAGSYLDKVASGITKQGVQVSHAVVSGPVAESIVAWAEQNQGDLIALMSHGLGRAARWVFGSVADRLLQSATLPVLVVRVSQEVLEEQQEYEAEQLDQAVLEALKVPQPKQ